MKQPQTIEHHAAACLDAASYSPRKLVLIHSGAALGFSLLLTVLNFIVSQSMDNTGGLSGIGMRSVLGTIQTILQYASTFLLPFWQVGFLAAALAVARKQPFGVHTLLRGFQRFPSVLGLLFAEGAVSILVAFVCIYLSTGIFMVTPFAEPFMQAIQPALEEATLLSGSEIYLDEATLLAASEALLPAMILFVAVYGLVMIPISYHFRMADFILMDNERIGGLRALVTSVKLMRRNCISLFRLDLRFWWFYILQVLTLVLGYGDYLLPLLGIELPMHTDVAYFLFYILHLAAQLALFVWAKAKVQTSYALVYEELKTTVPQPKPQPEVKKLPWDYE